MPTELTTAIREQGRQTRRNRKQAAQQQMIVREHSEQQRQATAVQRQQLRSQEIKERSQARLETQEELANMRRSQRIQNAAIFDTASSIKSSFGMVLILFFVMIVIYTIVKNGENFNTLTGSVGKFISGFSSNSPLFIKTDPTQGG